MDHVTRGYQNQHNDNDHSGEDKSNEKDRKQRWMRIWVTIHRQFSTIPTHRSISRHFSAISILCPPTTLISSLLIMTTWMDLTGACHRLSLTVQYRINHGFFLTHLQHYCVFLLSHNLISMLEGHVTSILHINCQKEIRESSFNMTRGGWRYWNSKLEILAAPLASGSIF